MMHKEVVVRKRTHVIAITLLLITVMLYICEGIDALKINNLFLLQLANTFVIVVTAAFILREYMSCKISYKYSIIANKLIINKLYRKHEKNLESIRIDEIVYIGKKNKLPKEYKVKCMGKYTCDILGTESLCCVYKRNGKLSMFNFEPSKDLINGIKRYHKKLNIE
ncbi:hypothetical protein ACQPU1_15580 [Clostridium paraputrificum]|uniref:hypothetical protein n=1 Tax=Clostridium TaxID=1485 RepID=UPI003D32CDC5